MIRATRETIRNDVGLTLDVYDFEIEIRNDILPMNLTIRQLRLSLEILQRAMIRHDGELGTHEIVTPCPECLNNRK